MNIPSLTMSFLAFLLIVILASLSAVQMAGGGQNTQFVGMNKDQDNMFHQRIGMEVSVLPNHAKGVLGECSVETGYCEINTENNGIKLVYFHYISLIPLEYRKS